MDKKRAARRVGGDEASEPDLQADDDNDVDGELDDEHDDELEDGAQDCEDSDQSGAIETPQRKKTPRLRRSSTASTVEASKFEATPTSDKKRVHRARDRCGRD